MPRLTVVIPVYNAARTLPDALRSLQAQTMEDWEAIVVVEGTDPSYNVARAFGERDPRIGALYLGREGGGCRGRATASIYAMEIGTGRYVANLDADDYWLPEFAERCVGELDTSPLVSGVYTDFIEWYEADGIKRVHRCPDFDMGRLVRENYVPFSSFVSRAWLWPDPKWEPVADWDVVVRTAKGGCLARIPEILSVRRMHPGQVSRGLGGPRTVLKKLALPYRHGGAAVGTLAALDQIRRAAWLLAGGSR